MTPFLRLVGAPLGLLLGVLGAGLALALVPTAGLLVLLVLAVGAGWGWARAGLAWPGWMWSSTLVVPVAVVGTVGWLAAGAPGAVLAAGVLTWAAVAWSRRAADADADPGTSSYPVSAPTLPSAALELPTRDDLADGRDTDRWTDAELCRIWRQTYAQVVAASTPRTLLALVDCRGAGLDELERRNPAGLTAWISSGARAAGDPEPYLQH